jgi:DNA-binding MarR family transcriptional regulator
MAKSRGSRDAITMPALLRHARTGYAVAMRTALAKAGYDDIPKNGLYVIGGLALQAANHPLGKLIEHLSLSKQAAGYLVDTLVTRGYLDRQVDGGDRRRLTVDLTERGKSAAKVLIAAGATVDAELLSQVGAKDVERTRRTLLALVDIGRKLIAQGIVPWK